MKRSEHEDIILEHISALAWANDAKTRAFVRRIAGYFGIIDRPEVWDGKGNPPGWRNPDMWRFGEFGDYLDPDRFQRKPKSRKTIDSLAAPAQ